MKITDHISANLGAWMSANQNLDTIKKVAAKSHVGFGTVRRVRNGDGNPTITNLCDIAKAFGRSVEDLIAPPGNAVNVIPISQVESNAKDVSQAMKELLVLTDTMDESQLWQLAGVARLFIHTLPAQKNTEEATKSGGKK